MSGHTESHLQGSTDQSFALQDRNTVARQAPAVGIVCFLVAGGLIIAEADSNAEIYLMGALLAVGTAVIFGLVLPRGLRRDAAGGRGLVLAGIGALLVVPAFWSGLPLPLGAAAVLLGWAGHRAFRGSGLCVASLVLGALVCLTYLMIYLSDITAGG